MHKNKIKVFLNIKKGEHNALLNNTDYILVMVTVTIYTTLWC